LQQQKEQRSHAHDQQRQAPHEYGAAQPPADNQLQRGAHEQHQRWPNR
jgi:hypothetical protein